MFLPFSLREIDSQNSFLAGKPLTTRFWHSGFRVQILIEASGLCIADIKECGEGLIKEETRGMQLNRSEE